VIAPEVPVTANAWQPGGALVATESTRVLVALPLGGGVTTETLKVH
jgi:hypothetical protein